MERNLYKDKEPGNDNQERNSNASRDGYTTKYNSRDGQQSHSTPHNDNKTQNSMDPDLKSLIFQFLSQS